MMECFLTVAHGGFDQRAQPVRERVFGAAHDPATSRLPLMKLYGLTPANDFGPRKLKALPAVICCAA